MRNEKLRLQRKGIKILVSDSEFMFPDFAVCVRGLIGLKKKIHGRIILNVLHSESEERILPRWVQF